MTASADQSPAKSKAAAGRRGPAPGGTTLGQDNTRDARRLAAAVLEVLAGVRTPTEAAQALSVSVPRYYQIETRALRGLLEACEAKPRGPGPNPLKQVNALRRENQRLQRDITRQQALVRAAQRTMGLAAPPAAPPTAKPGKKTRKRRVARALSVATRLQSSNPGPATPTETPTEASPSPQAAS